MDFNLTITCLALLVICGYSVLAVIHPTFDDTIIQRICLAGICLFSLGMSYQFWRTDYAPEVVQWFIWFIAAYAVETTRKLGNKAKRK